MGACPLTVKRVIFWHFYDFRFLGVFGYLFESESLETKCKSPPPPKITVNAYSTTIILMLFHSTISLKVYSNLLRCSTARWSISGFSLVGPTKVKAY